MNTLGTKRCSGVVLRAFIIFSILAFGLAGCKKDPTTEPVKPATLEHHVIVDRDTVTSGQAVTFTITSKNADSCVAFLSCGEKHGITTNGTKTFTPTESTNFTFTFYRKGDAYQESESKSVIVNPPASLPTIHFSSIPEDGRVQSGTSVRIILQTTNANSVTTNLPGFQGLSDTCSVTLTETTTFTGVAHGQNNQTASSSITIVVDPPPADTTMLEYLKLHSWGIVSEVCKYYENDPWTNVTLNSNVLLHEIWFRDNGWGETYMYGVLISNGPYSLVDSTLEWGNTRTVLFINHDTMILYSHEPCQSCPQGFMIVQDTYHKFGQKK